MAHDITAQDQVALYRTPAWHGIGNVIQSEMSPMEAMKAAELDWEVAAVVPDWTYGGITRPSETAQCILRLPREGKLDRAGNPEEIIELGRTGPEWTPIQNHEMFALAEAGAGMGVKIESAGSLSQGRRVFTLLRGDSFMADGKADQVFKYLLLCMGHDGELTLRAQPTSIRVVCKNTLRMALKGNNFFSIRHTGDIKGKLTEMATAIAHFRKTGDEFQDAVQVLHRKKMNEESLRTFWQEAWMFLNGEKEGEVATPRRGARAKEDLWNWQASMETERMELGADDVTLWLAMNAVTRHIQYREPGKSLLNSPINHADIRQRENLMGKFENRSAHIFKRALALV